MLQKRSPPHVCLLRVPTPPVQQFHPQLPPTPLGVSAPLGHAGVRSGQSSASPPTVMRPPTLDVAPPVPPPLAPPVEHTSPPISPASHVPFPHVISLHSPVHSLPISPLCMPLSHCSASCRSPSVSTHIASIYPFPHPDGRQELLQLSELSEFPSSHISTQ